MKRKFLSALLSVALVSTLFIGCGSAEQAPAATTDSVETAEAPAAEAPAAEAPAAEVASGANKVGVAMPTQSSERWINDGANMKTKLEALGYEVDLDCKWSKLFGYSIH